MRVLSILGSGVMFLVHLFTFLEMDSEAITYERITLTLLFCTFCICLSIYENWD